MVRNYIIVTASYWGFTLVDGALRMLVLFHFFRLGYTPFTLAFLFLLHEAAGIGANLAGGYFCIAFRHSSHARDRPDAPDRWLTNVVRAGPRMGGCGIGRVGGDCSRDCRRCQGSDQDRIEIHDQGDLRRWQRAIVPVGRLVHRLEERDEGQSDSHMRYG